MASNSPARRRSPSNSRRKTIAAQPPRQRKQRQIDRSAPLFIYLVRLIILGLGGLTIVGTTISIVNPPQPQPITPPIQSPSIPPR